MGGSLLDTYGSRQAQVTDCCEHGDETSVSINVLCYCNSYCVCPVTVTVIVYALLL